MKEYSKPEMEVKEFVVTECCTTSNPDHLGGGGDSGTHSNGIYVEAD